jgi:hypothetical protein
MNRHEAARLWSAPAERSDDGALDRRGRRYFAVAPFDEKRCRASLATALRDAVAPTERPPRFMAGGQVKGNRWLPMNLKMAPLVSTQVRCPGSWPVGRS